MTSNDRRLGIFAQAIANADQPLLIATVLTLAQMLLDVRDGRMTPPPSAYDAAAVAADAASLVADTATHERIFPPAEAALRAAFRADASLRPAAPTANTLAEIQRTASAAIARAKGAAA
jgi:hypothetical protein